MTDKKDKNEPEGLVGAILDGIEDVKGENIVTLDLTDIDQAIADYFIITNANSNTQVRAIANSVEKKVRNNLKERPVHSEGKENATWILLDYGNVIVHVFQTDTREYYNIESLWNDATEVSVTNLK